VGAALFGVVCFVVDPSLPRFIGGTPLNPAETPAWAGPGGQWRIVDHTVVVRFRRGGRISTEVKTVVPSGPRGRLVEGKHPAQLAHRLTLKVVRV
jgi:hypothetical protein